MAWQLVLFGFWLVVTGVALCLTPNPAGHGTHTQLGLPPCVSYLLTGRPCPGCGMTTSFALTVRGELTAAFRANPFGPVAYGIFTAFALASLYGFMAVRRLDFGGAPFNWAVGALIVVYLAYGIVRFAYTPPEPPWARFDGPVADGSS